MKIKKIIFTVSALYLTLSLFISCGNKLPQADEFGIFHELSDGVKTAKSEKKNILLFITMGGFDAESDDFVSKILHSPEYKSSLGGKYVTVHFDFGSEAYMNSEVSHFTTDEERKAAEALNAQISRNVSLARTLNLTYTPCVFLMNEDGYAFADELYSEVFDSVESLSEMISEYEPDFVTFQEMVDETKKGTPVERMEALNVIYQIIDDKYLPTLKELFKSAPEMDKKNESGLVSYLYFVYLMEESKKFTAAGDFVSAVGVLRDAAQSDTLEGEEKQQAFYMAANLLIQAGASDFTAILGLLNNAVLASPETDLAETCRGIILQATEILSGNVDDSESSSEVK